jgi:hypothetical protein
VRLRFTITPSRRAAEVTTDLNTLGDDSVPRCIEGLVRAWIFPFAPEEPVPVSYPFVFAPASL